MTGRPADRRTNRLHLLIILYLFIVCILLKTENRQPKTVSYYTIEKTIFVHYHGKSAEAFRHPDSNP